jgi:drug/metabolite transporter (DMT)-like permease
MAAGYLLALAASVLWGLTYCLDQKVLTSLSVDKLYFLHSLFGVILCGAIWLLKGRSFGELFAVDPAQLDPKVLVIALLVGAAAGLAIFGSVQILGASKASILEISYPVFVALFSILFFGEVLTTPVILGGLLIFAGSAIVISWR